MDPSRETTPPAAAPGCRGPRWIAAIAVAACAAAFGATLGGGFLGDDFGYVGRFHAFALADWPRLFVREWSEGLWGAPLRELRPLTALSFLLDAQAWGANALGFRLTNLLLHALGATLVGQIAWRVAGREPVCGAVAAVLFALHPVHAEPVLWITGRVDVIATVFYLAAFGATMRARETGSRRWLAAAIASYAAAVFSKEFGLTLPVMLLLADALRLTRRDPWRTARTWAPYAGFAVVLTVYYCCRRAAFGPGGAGAAWPDLAAPEFWRDFAQRELTYLAHLLPPLERWVGPGTPAFDRHALAALGGGALALALGLAAIVFGLRRARAPRAESRAAILFFAAGWHLVATLPLLVTYVSARHLYLASAGACIALGLLLQMAFRARAALIAAALGLAAFFGVRLAETTSAWREAGRHSRDIARELAVVEREAAPGAAIVLDVPHDIRNAFLWEWSVPFALRPPFTREPLDARFVVAEPMPVYFDWDRWAQQPAHAQLARVEAPSWLIQCAEGKPVRRIAVPPEKLRAAAQRFAADTLKDDPHGAWRRFVAELAAR